MRWRLIATLTGLLFSLVTNVPAQSKHNRILPSPKEISYGFASLSLGHVPIRLVIPEGQNGSDDRFAMSTLSRCVAQATGEPPSETVSAGGRAITLTRNGSSDPLPLPGESPGPASREAYTIDVNSDGAAIGARSSAGLYYGVETFCQMIEKDKVPEAHVRDWPAQAYRGTMVDMSEGPLLRVSEIKRQIDLMARWKNNQYYFYNETSIELDGMPPAAPAARLSKTDVRDVVAYGRERHIDVVPCLELYGHLHDLFRREQFSSLADYPHGVEFNVSDPRVQTLIADWSEQYMQLFPSAFVHVGFDETWQLQQAAARGAEDPSAVFLKQLNHVAALFSSHGKTILAWADIIVKYPAIARGLPSGLIAVPWYYDPRPDPQYRQWLQPLLDNHVPMIVAPGVNGWNEIAPDFQLSFDNIDTLVAAGRKAEALGVMNTVWSDDVQMLKSPALPGIAYGATAAWQATPVDRLHFFPAYAAREYPHGATSVAAALDHMARSETALQTVLGQNTMIALWGDAFAPEVMARAEAHAEALRQSRLDAEAAEEEWLRATAQGVDPSRAQAYLVECRLLDYAGMKFQYAVEITKQWKLLGKHPSADRLGDDFENIVVSQQHGKLSDLMEAISGLKPQYEEAWLREYTQYRLPSALGRWDAEYDYWRRLQASLSRFIEHYDPARGLPPLETLLP